MKALCNIKISTIGSMQIIERVSLCSHAVSDGISIFGYTQVCEDN